MAHRYQLSGLPDHEQSPSNLSELCHQDSQSILVLPVSSFNLGFSADPFLGNQAGEIVQD